MHQPVPAPQREPARLSMRQQLAVAGTLGLIGVALVSLWLTSGSGADRGLSASEQLIRAVQFDRAMPLLLTPVAAAERSTALETMQLPAAEQQALEQRQTELVWLTLWDDVDEDGDSVRITGGGFGQSVHLAHQPIRVAVPKPADGLISITGLRDGGGGITLAIGTPAGQLPVPVMSPGQTIGLRVR